MEIDELEKTVEELEQEVLDELDNPYKPYRVVVPYEVSFTFPQDGHNTELTIRTRSEEVRYGRNEKDVLLQKEIDNRLSRKTYSKHIINWVRERLWYIDLDECDLEYTGKPSVSPMTKKEVKDFTETCLNEDV